jgi:hypothetical protein
MRYKWLLVALTVVAAPALADDKPANHTRMTWEERFARANAAHDGHLTLDEAKAGYKTVAKHFQEIDTDGKGYVTENDIRAWHALQKAARQAPRQDDPLRPRPAFNRAPAEQRTMTTTHAHSVVMTVESDIQP